MRIDMGAMTNILKANPGISADTLIFSLGAHAKVRAGRRPEFVRQARLVLAELVRRGWLVKGDGDGLTIAPEADREARSIDWAMEAIAEGRDVPDYVRDAVKKHFDAALSEFSEDAKMLGTGASAKHDLALCVLQRKLGLDQSQAEQAIGSLGEGWGLPEVYEYVVKAKREAKA